MLGKKIQKTERFTAEELNRKRKVGIASCSDDILDVIRRRCLTIGRLSQQLDRAHLSIYGASILMFEEKTRRSKAPKVFWLSYNPWARLTIVVDRDMMPDMVSTELRVKPPDGDHPDFVLMMPAPNHFIRILMPNNVAWSKPKADNAESPKKAA